MDTDYIVSNDSLNKVFDSKEDFLINYKAQHVDFNSKYTDEMKYVSDTGIEMCWATVFYFKKVFINPIIEEERGKKWPFTEGCLSIPGIREEVIRENIIKISYFDEKWNFHEEEYTGVAARIIQHEYDHIEGILFTDHLNPLKRRMLKRRLTDISRGEVSVTYRMKFPK